MGQELAPLALCVIIAIIIHIYMRRIMLKTIQVTIDNVLLERVDGLSDSLGMARSAFIRQALELALRELQVADLEQRQISGYQRQPVTVGEFDDWEDEQAWGES